MQLPLIVILGPTASGKTGYAIRLARLIGGEIICADSRTVYKGMDIGTAKPTKHEREMVPHWAIDLVEPNQRFTLYDFQRYAQAKIGEIRERGHVPMLVGGSGLYIDSVIYDYQLSHEPEFDMVRRQQLESLSLSELKNYAISQQIELPSDTQNRRRLIRAIEQGGVNKKCSQLIPNTIVISIATDKETLRQRSTQRSQTMLDDGLINETAELLSKYGATEPLRRNAYGVVQQYLAGEIGIGELVPLMVRRDMQLVKKQLTWWRNQRRAGDIMWRDLASLNKQLDAMADESVEAIVSTLTSEYKKFRKQ